jgi:cytochrome c553
MTQGALIIAACAAMLSVSASAAAAGNAESGKAKAGACMACHGPDGNSPADTWPKLAGQMPEYITKQLQDFRAGLRSNEQMSPMAKPLSDPDIADLAAYFSSQQVKLGEGKPELLAQGQSIFLKGKGRPGVVAACTGCHGATGAGNHDWKAYYSKTPSVLAPAIGSQQQAYVVKQLKAYRDGTRANDVGHVMRNIAVRLDDNDIAAVAEYVATLTR